MWRGLFAAVLIAAFACTANASSKMAALVQARLVRVEQGGLAPNGGDVNFSIAFRLTFRISKVLAGSYPNAIIVTTAYRGSMPVEGHEYFLLIAHHANGDEVVWFEPSMTGLCISESQAGDYGLVKQLRSLQHRYPCK
jgi:hypothetical protein